MHCVAGALILLLVAPAARSRGVSSIPPSPAAPSAVVSLWPAGEMPGHGAKGPQHKLPAHGDHVIRITDISHPTLSLYPASKKDVAEPAMIICPGGGYDYLAYNKEGTEIAWWLNSLGIEAMVLKYRVPHNRHGALQDAQRAISMARANADKWHIDAKRLGIIGFSAGGDLAARASTLFNHRSYQAIDAVDHYSCRPDFVILVYPAYLERHGHVASDLDLKAHIPPTLIIHNTDDREFVRGSEMYHAALDKAHIPNKLIIYPTGGHGYGLRSKKSVRVWPLAAAKWLHKIDVLGAVGRMSGE